MPRTAAHTVFTLRIDTTNAAFEADRDLELARILRALARKIEIMGADDAIRLLDLDGNTVGKTSSR